MKIYCDTSVLIAASVADHPQHLQAFALLKQVRDKKHRGYTSTHGLAEFFAVLTRAPFDPPIYPSEAWQLVAGNILPNFDIVALDAEQYQSVLRDAAAKGWVGGLIYDALHLAAAESVPCERIFTFNLRHLRQLVVTGDRRICSP